MPLFDAVTLRGARGRVAWGYRTAAEIGTWSICRPKGPDAEWTLTASIASVDRYQVRQRPLLFTAPRRGGLWCWPIQRVHALDDHRIIATLGAPEQ